MITDWIFHPFGHLEGGCRAMPHNMGQGMMIPREGVVRRMIFLRVETGGSGTGVSEVFGINSRRVPLFVADVDIHNLKMKDVHDLPAETGWGRVPTPIF